MSLSSWRSFMKCPLIICKAFRQISMSAFLFTSGTPSGNTPLSSVAFAFPEKCSAERTLAEESSEYDLTGATLAVLSRGSAKVKKHRKSGAFLLWYPQRESNPQLPLRRGPLYPFNYGGMCFFFDHLRQVIMLSCNAVGRLREVSDG